jgi:hypothetical protein
MSNHGARRQFACAGAAASLAALLRRNTFHESFTARGDSNLSMEPFE